VLKQNRISPLQDCYYATIYEGHCHNRNILITRFKKLSGADAIKKFTPSLGIPDLGV